MFHINELMDKLNVTSFDRNQLDIIDNHQKQIGRSFREVILFGFIFYLINCLETSSNVLNIFLLAIDIAISCYMLHLVIFMCFGDSILVRKLKKTFKEGIEV